MSKDDIKFKEKAQNLESNLDQIHQMYQKVTGEKKRFKEEKTMAEKKLARQEEKAEMLEGKYAAARTKQQEYANVIKMLK